MPADERERCFDCMRPLSSDGIEWTCKPCGRGGYHDRVTLPDGRVIAVRVVTYWSGP